MRAYKEYKDSGVVWLGKVPTHWSTPKIAYIMNYLGSGTTPKSSHDEYYDGDIPWVTTSELREGVVLDTKKKVTKLAVKDNSALKLHPVNSIVIAMYGATIGRLARLGIESTTNQACCVLPPSSKVSTDFLFYWLECHRKEIVELGYGGGQPNISQDTISNLRLSLPTRDEQNKIVAFLSSRISHIDNLITEKQNFINLLEEKRQALISHVVTKGLDTSVEMKDSGVEWIGEVPAHWVVMRMKHVSKLNAGTKKKQLANDEEIEFLPMSNVDEVAGEIRQFDMRKYAEVSSGYTAFQTNDVIFAKITPCMENGNCVLVPELKHGYAFGSTEFIVFRANNKFLPEYLFYVLRNKELRKICETFMTGTAGQQRISTDFLAEFPVAVPSIDEQKHIVEYIRKNNARLYDLKQETKRSIELLKERRAALISAAVTGKIDVREAV